MSKIFINTMDKQVEYEYSSCTLVTENYKVKLKRNEIHSPVAAKLIVEFKNKLIAFLLKQPIITIDNNKEIEVLTTMTWEAATYKDKKEYSKKEVKKLTHAKKLLEAKKSIGLSFDEINSEKEVLSQLSILKLKKKILKQNEGGGF